MGKLIISLHTSIDGFVAGPEGEMNWIGIDDEMFDFVGQMTDSADYAFYGRNTFEMMDAYWPTAGQPENASRHDKEHSAWYNKVDKFVLSNSMMGKDRDKVRFINEEGLGAVAEAKQQSNILMFGSPGAIHTLFARDMVDEMYLFVNPVLLGEGIPLFRGIHENMKWKLEATRLFKSGSIVALHYSRIR